MTMDWKDLASTVGRVAPLLGTLLGGPAGPAIGGLVASVLGTGNSPDDVGQVLASNPDAAVKLRQIEADRQAKLQELATDQVKAELAAATRNAGDVNRTMQAEAASEHWPTYTWRPFIGFAVGANVVASSVLVLVVFVPVMFGNKAAAGAVAQLPMVLGALAGINATVLPILGIASWFRGRMQSQQGGVNVG